MPYAEQGGPDPGGNLPLARAARALAEAAAALAAAAQGLGATPAAASSPAPPASLSLASAINEFLLAKSRAGRSHNYVKTLRVTLASFARGLEGFPAAAISARHVETWAARRFTNPKTRRQYLGDVKTLFNWLHRRAMIPHNPAAAVELPSVPARPARIHTPEAAAAVLELARRIHPDLALFCAVKYFAGLRTAEALRLAPEDLGAAYVEVTAAKAKTRARRLVPISANLRAWLELGGQVPLRDAHSKIYALNRAAAAAGISTPPNVARHSFCSYRLAQSQDAASTALEAGHSQEILFSTYRELVTPEAAARYFAIRPSAAAFP